MFGLMVGTLIKSDEAQSKYAWWPGLGLSFIELLPQGHGKVISRSHQGQINTKGWK